MAAVASKPVPELRIAAMRASDWPAVHAIYREGIATGHATFEAAPPDGWDRFVGGHVPGCSLVACAGGEVVAWAALTPVSGRCIYAGVAELSIYVSAARRGAGIGGALLDALAERAEARGIWTLQAGVFPENGASVALLRRAGFRDVGRRQRLGRMGFGPLAGRWRDVLLLERRSTRVGND